MLSGKRDQLSTQNKDVHRTSFFKWSWRDWFSLFLHLASETYGIFHKKEKKNPLKKDFGVVCRIIYLEAIGIHYILYIRGNGRGTSESIIKI